MTKHIGEMYGHWLVGYDVDGNGLTGDSMSPVEVEL